MMMMMMMISSVTYLHTNAMSCGYVPVIG